MIKIEEFTEILQYNGGRIFNQVTVIGNIDLRETSTGRFVCDFCNKLYTYVILVDLEVSGAKDLLFSKTVCVHCFSKEINNLFQIKELIQKLCFPEQKLE